MTNDYFILFILVLLCYYTNSINADCFESQCNLGLAYTYEDANIIDLFIKEKSGNFIDDKKCIIIEENDSHSYGKYQWQCQIGESSGLNRVTIHRNPGNGITKERDLKTFNITPMTLDGIPDLNQGMTYGVLKLPSRPVVNAWINISSPINGAILMEESIVDITFNPNFIPDGRDKVVISVEGVMEPLVRPVSSRHFQLSNSNGYAEPATWFIHMHPVLPSTTAFNNGYINTIHIELVLKPETISRERRLINRNVRIGNQKEETLKDTKVKMNHELNICTWISPQMDGQKTIWLSQLQHMPQNYRFTWILTDELSPSLVAALIARGFLKANATTFTTATITDNIKTQRYKQILSPLLNIDLDLKSNLQESPEEGESFVDWAETQANHKSTPKNTQEKDQKWNKLMDSYIMHRFQIAKKRVRSSTTTNNISEKERSFLLTQVLEPKWLRDSYHAIQQLYQQENCDIVVHGNMPSSKADIMLVEASRSLGLPIISELCNLYPQVDIVPDVVVAASSYAAEHKSVRLYDDTVRRVVISPSVDTQVYRKLRGVSTETNMNADSNVNDERNTDNIVIGFVGRLSAEKNPGLFLMTARAILNTMETELKQQISTSTLKDQVKRPKVHFVVIGAGHLLQNLIEHSHFLGLSSFITFTGWISSDRMPLLLNQIDILVNPSLRAWSETFCIANIEAMASEVAIVTFGVGGVGEYVGKQIPRHSPIYDALNIRNDSRLDLTENAVLVNEAKPEALAAGVTLLMRNHALRTAMALSGREMVVNHFDLYKQMALYDELYMSLL